MKRPRGENVTLEAITNAQFLPLATSFVEKAASAFGMDEQSVLSITLATEEIFGYLCQVTEQHNPIKIQLTNGGYFVRADFAFQAKDFDMRAFNLTTHASFDDEETAAETGLLIASRIVDRFKFTQSDGVLGLTLVKEKTYPEASALDYQPPKDLEDFSLHMASTEELKIFVRAVMSYYASIPVPSIFRYPGKLIDMVESGDYYVALAVDRHGHIGGGIVWRWESEKMVECYGPYVFGQTTESDMAHSILDFCIGRIAKSGALGLINRYPTPELPLEYFEPLGEVTLRQVHGQTVKINAHYRHLEEDLGLVVWSHPSLEDFLKKEYNRLVFAREVQFISDEGEASPPHSVLAAEFDRAYGTVTLRPVWWGLDAHTSLESYVKLLSNEDISCTTLEIDLGKPWQSRFVPAIIDNGFQPRFILPYGGKGDLVIFEHKVN